MLVDEYQDTNHAQYRLLQLLAGEHRNVFAVGDPDQSIYAFRGADIRNILEFERDFAGTRTIALEQNYRSTNSILGAANAVIENNRERKPKHLFSELGEGEPGRGDRGRGRARRGALRRRRDRGARRGGLLRRRDRGLLPDERAVPRARGRARPPGHPLPGDRRPALLRARRDQGRRRLPAGARQPGRRGLADADREPAAARDRRHLARAARHLRRRAGASRSGRRSAAPTRRGSAPRPSERSRASRALLESLRRAAQELVRRELVENVLGRSRLPRGARGRADDRGARPDREPAGARRRRAASTTRAGGRALALRLPPGDLALLRPGRAARASSRSSR